MLRMGVSFCSSDSSGVSLRMRQRLMSLFQDFVPSLDFMS